MKLSQKLTPEDKAFGQGRAIARGIASENARKERNMASAVKRKATRLENAAEIALSGGGVKFNAPEIRST